MMPILVQSNAWTKIVKNIYFSKINSFEGTGHLFKKISYIPLICALSLAGFGTKLHLKLRQCCSLKCHDFTFQSRILQVYKGHLILLSVILFDVGKFPPPEPSSGSESSFFRGATVFFGHHNAISDSGAWNRQTCGQTEGRNQKNQRRNVGLMLHQIIGAVVILRICCCQKQLWCLSMCTAKQTRTEQWGKETRERSERRWCDAEEGPGSSPTGPKASACLSSGWWSGPASASWLIAWGSTNWIIVLIN